MKNRRDIYIPKIYINQTLSYHTFMNAKPEYNFITVELCDNDFGWRMKDALQSLIDNAGLDFCPTIAKKYIVEHIMLSEILKGGDYENSYTRTYLTEGITVEFRKTLPSYDPYEQQDKDHDGGSVYYDGGSVYYDVNLDQIHQF